MPSTNSAAHADVSGIHATGRCRDLIGEQSTRSDEFRFRWAAHRVLLHHYGVKAFRHPAVGNFTLAFEALSLPGDPDLTLAAYSAEPGSPSHDALTLLSTWSEVG